MWQLRYYGIARYTGEVLATYTRKYDALRGLYRRAIREGKSPHWYGVNKIGH